MKIQTICVLGGSGFVGRALVSRLAASGKQVRIPSRKRERSKELILLPTVEVIEADIHDDRELVRQFRGMDAVINLVGILHGERRAGAKAQTQQQGGFERCHVELPRKVAQACAEAGVGRLLHMSALGASATSPSAYQRSKAAGETIVREAGLRKGKSEGSARSESGRNPGSGIDVTIFRPSVIFGREDSFFNLFAQLVRWFPVFPLANAQARFQPVWVEDVARAISERLEDRDSFGQTYELCGPRVYSLREIVEYAAHLQELHTRIIPLSDRLSFLQAWAMEFKPGAKLMTRDNHHAMQQDNVCQGQWPFGFAPTAIEAVVPTYLGRQSPRARYYAFRGHARRR